MKVFSRQSYGVFTPLHLAPVFGQMPSGLEAEIKDSGTAKQNGKIVSSQLIMKTKILSVIAAVIGSLCVLFAFWVQDVAVPLVAGISPTGGRFESKYFWWPLFAGIIFWVLAGLGFIWCKRRRHSQAASHEDSSVKH
jgi:hypothetical protein